MRTDKILASQARMILKDYSAVLDAVIEEIRKEQEAPINSQSCEVISLEYMKRQGIKQGLVLLRQRLTTYSDVRD